MTMTTVRPPDRETTTPVQHHLAARLSGAALALAVAYVHVTDQGGFPGAKAPTYVGIGYYLLEAAGLVAAVALIAGPGRHTTKAWLFTVGVAAGPLLGFVLSRGPGLPAYTDDKGNWTEPLGLISLVVEGALLLVAAAVLARSHHTEE
jgi:hypothetical protein